MLRFRSVSLPTVQVRTNEDGWTIGSKSRMHTSIPHYFLERTRSLLGLWIRVQQPIFSFYQSTAPFGHGSRRPVSFTSTQSRSGFSIVKVPIRSSLQREGTARQLSDRGVQQEEKTVRVLIRNCPYWRQCVSDVVEGASDIATFVRLSRATSLAVRRSVVIASTVSTRRHVLVPRMYFRFPVKITNSPVAATSFSTALK